MHVVAVDVGTSAVRAALVRTDGTIVSGSQVRRHSGLGGSTFDARVLGRNVIDALAQLALHENPSALAISSHIGTVAVDECREPVDTAGSWADPRGQEELARFDPDIVAEILRGSGRPNLAGGALAYLVAQPPETVRQIHSVLSPKDFLVALLTGRIATDTINAAYTLAYDVRARSWNRTVLDQVGVDAAVLPEFMEPTAVVGELERSAAADTGLPVGLPVIAGGPDGSVGISLLLGTSEDMVADVGGTTDVLGRLVPATGEPPADAVVNPAVLPERVVAGGATGMTGGAVARWRELVGAVSDEHLAELPPGSDGLFMVPTMTGSRFPRWRPDERGALVGQCPEHGPAHVLRAAQEAAAFTLREGVDVLDPTGRRPVAFAGGSARSSSVAQLRADVLGRPVLTGADPDVTLLGTAMIAFLGAGATHTMDELRHAMLGPLREIAPKSGASRRYQDIYQQWLELRTNTTSRR